MGVHERERAPELATLDGVDALLADRAVRSVSVALVTGGELAWARAWGEASSGRPASAEMLYQAASISKPVAAMGALRLVADGRLTLDDPIEPALTSWRIPAVGGWRPKVTLRMLLTHTCGLSVWGFPGYGHGAEVATPVQVLDGAPPSNTPAIVPEAVPGLMWRYSGGGYTVLQQLIEDASAVPFAQAMRSLVLGPLGMHDTTYEQPLPTRLHDRAAHAHIGLDPIPGRWHTYPEMAAAGMWTTPSDLMRFALGVEAAITGRPGAFLPPALGASIVQPSTVQPQAGLGFVVGRDPEVRAHSGSNAGFQCTMVWSPDASVGVAAMTNGPGGPVASELVRFLGAEHGVPNLRQDYPHVQEAIAGMTRVRRVEPQDGAQPAAPAAATYRLSTPAVDLDVAVETADGVLRMSCPGQDPVELRPSSEGGWTFPALPLHVTFERDGKAMRVAQLGREAVFEAM